MLRTGTPSIKIAYYVVKAIGKAETMNLYILVDAENIQSQNGEKNTAIVTVDLSSFWNEICRQYTYIHLDLQIYIPVIEAETITFEISKDYEVAAILDCKVVLTVSYCQKEDSTRKAYGTAYMFGYRKTNGNEEWNTCQISS